MPTFIVQACYTREGVKGLMSGAKGRRKAIGALIEAAGGTLKDMYMTTGSHDVLAIAEMPDGADSMAVNMAIAASGVADSFQTMRAWSPEEFEGVAEKAAKIAASYKAPGS
ncbi:GYD domain-containing protein [Roseibacterium sp. SDUM158017]|uniref:GYD domain-containing protein n=1 Tax=Roseicyclus salinarum TaxID=3036773 RepID=UPI002415842B|nr:GYD domain-containing protein [Roseibacterium sp. SDUM158017]MDG4647598.1 GYD domain-containing protein [Roseibacterium sp. SDUM158017]